MPSASPNGVFVFVAFVAGAFAAKRARGKARAALATETQQPDAFATLVRLTYMGYYSRPDLTTSLIP